MSVGSDGFTKCNYVCDPYNAMKWSCKKYCKDFVFVAPTSTAQPRVHVETYVVVLIVLSCVGVVAFIAICCFRKKIRAFIKKCRDKRLPYPKQAENGTINEEDDRFLVNQNDRIEGRTVETDVPHETYSDSGISLENSSVHAIDETTGNEENLDMRSGIMRENREPAFSHIDQHHDQGLVEDIDDSPGIIPPELDTIHTKEKGLSRIAIGQLGGTDFLANAGVPSEKKVQA